MLVGSDESGTTAAVDALRAGKVVAFPTETVFALAASVNEPAAIDEIFRRKARGKDVPLPVLCATLDQADALAVITGRARRLAEQYWPGPLTLVCPRRRDIALDVGGDPATIGVRVPNHPVAATILARVGPLVATSANLHSEEPCERAQDAEALFGASMIVVREEPDSGTASATPASGTSSTVLAVDDRGEVTAILRQGDLFPSS